MASSQSLSKILGGDVNLYIGGKQDAKAKEVLQSLKISYILNCTPPRAMDPETGCQNFFEKEKAFVYKRIPVFDNRGEDLLQHMEESYRFIEEGKHYGGVLVHCHKGISRSASFVIGYLMKKNEMSLDEALDYIQSIRSIVQPNLAFMSQLRAYELQLANERSAAAANSSSNSSSSSSKHHGLSSMGPSVSAGPSVGPCIGPSTGPSTEPSPSCGPSLPGITTEPNNIVSTQESTDVSVSTVSIGPSGPPGQPFPCIGPPIGPSDHTSSIDIVTSVIGPASGPPIAVEGPQKDTDSSTDLDTSDDQPSKRAKLTPC